MRGAPLFKARIHELQKDFLIMARIIYKEGLEGQNRLECIEGIEIDLLNGQKALIYPKYSEEVLLDPKDRDRWHDAGISETAALRLRDNQAATAALLEAGSPAARFVTQFTSERLGRFGLPTLLAAMEITEQKCEIDKLAREIDGADLLDDFSSNVWSCSRCNTDDRLSVDRLELQQKSKQVRNLWTRLRHVEEALYIQPSDAFKEKEEDG